MVFEGSPAENRRGLVENSNCSSFMSFCPFALKFVSVTTLSKQLKKLLSEYVNSHSNTTNQTSLKSLQRIEGELCISVYIHSKERHSEALKIIENLISHRHMMRCDIKSC